MKRTIVMIVIAAAFALPAMAQNWNTQQVNPNNKEQRMTTQQATPSAVFQSTSSMKTSGSMYSSAPVLDADGTASHEGGSYTPDPTPGRPRRVPDPINVDDDIPEGGGLDGPIGDAVVPLLALACMYALYNITRVYRRKRRA